jgi:hypothetical protein
MTFGLRQPSNVGDFLQSIIGARARITLWALGLLLIAGIVMVPRAFSVPEEPPAASTAATTTQTAALTPTATPTPTQHEISATKTVFGALGFLFGFFLTYTITVGTKTQDVFKSFLGIAGLGGGVMETTIFSRGLQLEGLRACGAGALVGFVVYAVIAAILCDIYAWKYEGAAAAAVPAQGAAAAPGPPLPEQGWALFASALARALLGEELRPPPAAAK